MLRTASILLMTSSAILATSAIASSTENLRRVDGDTLFSKATPALQLVVDGAFTYVGANSYVIKEIARVERHHFVVADSAGRIEKLIIVQFEGFLDSVDNEYRFSIRNPVRLGEREYHHNTWVFDNASSIASGPGLESDMTNRHLKAQGYTQDDHLMMSRLARPVGADKRHEIIIFYLENAADHNVKLDEYYLDDDSINPKYLQLTDDFVKRSLKMFNVIKG